MKIFNLYKKTSKNDLIPLYEFKTYEEIQAYLKKNYNVDTDKERLKRVVYNNKVGLEQFINDTFTVYSDIL